MKARELGRANNTNRTMPEQTLRAVVDGNILRLSNGYHHVELHGNPADLIAIAREISRVVVRLDPDLAANLTRRFALTAAEADVAFALVQGLAPDEIAQGRGVSLHTVRNQVRIVMEKCGVRRRADLFRLATAA